MLERRKVRHNLSYEEEDHLIFAGPVQKILIGLGADVRKNNRGDVVMQGRIGNTPNVPIIFPGRRAKMVGPLHAQINKVALRAPHRKIGQVGPEMPVLVYGVWRSQFKRDSEGWEQRNHQLMAAAWAAIVDGEAQDLHGELPIAPAASVYADYG